MSYKKKPLPIGKKFNKLTILEESPSHNKRRYVYCECDCGSKKTIRYDVLKSGSVKSCGCIVSTRSAGHIQKISAARKRREITIAQNYIGKRYSNLVIQSQYHCPNLKGTWFNVLCDCGNTCAVSLTRMKIGHTKSCGCARRDKNAIQYTSEIDGELILVSGGNHQYKKTLKNNGIKSKEFLHVYEAKKAFAILGKKWQSNFIVHHIDHDKLNNKISNLSVFPDNSSHHTYHAELSKKMMQFLIDNDLLNEFYKQFPELKLETIKDLLNK